jgi:hypothetical protein
MQLLRYNYRVQVSRMILTSFVAARVGSGETSVTSVPVGVAHSNTSPCVTAGTEITAPTSLSLVRIHLCCLRAIAVTHY